ncbi:MAG: vitamin B12-dependent ribonucleotide reductase [bacterium]
MTDHSRKHNPPDDLSLLFDGVNEVEEKTALTIDELAPDSVLAEPATSPVAEPARETATETAPPAPGTGLRFEQRFTEPGINPLDEVRWELRTATIRNDKGEALFEQENVEIPKGWSQMATNVVVSKYFRGGLDTPEREQSVRQLIGRVVDTITGWGLKDGYFASDGDAEIFKAELAYLLVHQYASFNSPVWFNVGVEDKPQCSACFINSVEDSMASILDLAKTEGLLFKYGSGTGTNLSPLRSSRELLSTGGQASGPVSFMRGYDAFAGVIKSGGKTRRAAKMVILNVDHPDIEDFISCKVKEEKKAWALIDQGYDGSFNGEAYNSIFFQNSNNSVRVTDDFMRAVIDDKTWTTRSITDHEPVDTYRARDLMRKIAEGTHVCGDPGMQYDTTINDWHTCKNTDRIHASNPCSEYMFLNNSACNLASLNLMKFHTDGQFDVAAFRHAVRYLLVAMEIIVDNSSYPREEIGLNSQRFRPLGLGYANLGALLMARGLPYDSDEGRDYAAVITALMSGQAFATSAELAEELDSFSEYELNREPFLKVIRKHRAAINNINAHRIPADLLEAVHEVWTEAYTVGHDYGYRNAQVTVLAPTGTIAFMMDCDTTGIEPDIALIKYKKLVDGGILKIINHTVPVALARLGYDEDERARILSYLEENETIEGAPGLQEEHLPVFDCALQPQSGKRFIEHMGHLRMMAACQPFLSGAISKTVNVPNEATVDEIAQAFIEAWKMGLKAIAIYRDGSKRLQPLNTGKDHKKRRRHAPPAPQRVRLPDERQALTHKFSIAGHEGYLTVGLYPNGKPGEMFVAMAKEGSVVSGLMDSFATAVSIMLQYGVPLQVLINKFSHVRFEPSGVTSNPEIPIAKSVMDYIFRWLDQKFGEHTTALASTAQDVGLEEPASKQPGLDELLAEGLKAMEAAAGGGSRIQLEETEHQIFRTQADSPPCPECGSVMVRSGTCYKCLNCAATSGCS